MSCSIDCRCSSDHALLWLWLWLAATAPTGSLAWELPHASGAALKRQKDKKKKKKKEKEKRKKKFTETFRHSEIATPHFPTKSYTKIIRDSGLRTLIAL